MDRREPGAAGHGPQREPDASGTERETVGTVTYEDGTTEEISDYYFDVDRKETYSKIGVAVSEDVAGQLYLPGSGTLESSWQVLMKVQDSGLRELLESYRETADAADRSGLLDRILYAMAGSGTSASGRGKYVDARQINVIEKFYGERFESGGNPNAHSGSILTALYGNVRRYYEGWLSAQTTAAEYLEKAAVEMDPETGALRMDFSGVKAALNEKIESDFASGKQALADLANAMHSLGMSGDSGYVAMCREILAENDELAAAICSAGRIVIQGIAARDDLSDSGGNTILLGGAGNDVLRAHGNDAILAGGAGNDEFCGSRGDDPARWGSMVGTGKVSYLWNIGDGNDTIFNVANLERAQKAHGQSYLLMGAGITADRLEIGRDRNDVFIRYTGTNEKITVRDWFKDDAYKLDGILFADGSCMGQAALFSNATSFHATDGNDTLAGSSRDDTLDGGAGNDFMEGGLGDDLYVWGRGYGNDRISNRMRNYGGYGDDVDGGADWLYIKGCAPSDISWRVSDNSLLLSNVQTGETLKILDWFLHTLVRMDKVVFEDGTTYPDKRPD